MRKLLPFLWLLLTACGQIGPLYLPPAEPPVPVPATAAPIAKPPTAPVNAMPVKPQVKPNQVK